MTLVRGERSIKMSRLLPRVDENTPDILKKNQTTDPVIETANGDVVRFGEVVNCRSLNVRESPSMSAAVLHTLNSGEKVTIDWSTPPTRTGSFYKLIDGGYCRREYIKLR